MKVVNWVKIIAKLNWGAPVHLLLPTNSKSVGGKIFSGHLKAVLESHYRNYLVGTSDFLGLIDLFFK